MCGLLVNMSCLNCQRTYFRSVRERCWVSKIQSPFFRFGSCPTANHIITLSFSLGWLSKKRVDKSEAYLDLGELWEKYLFSVFQIGIDLWDIYGDPVAAPDSAWQPHGRAQGTTWTLNMKTAPYLWACLPETSLKSCLEFISIASLYISVPRNGLFYPLKGGCL